MTSTSRASLISKIQNVLKKHYKPVPSPKNRTVLEHLLFACCLENAPFDKAETAFSKVRESAFDWNEVRVTSVAEMSEQMGKLPDPRRAASNLKRALHSVFESQYSFDLEHLKKQNLGKTFKDLLRHDGTNAFIVSYVTQHALGGHSIPIDDGIRECLFIVGVIDEKERSNRKVPGLERAVPKKGGIEFASLLHQLGAEYTASPYSPTIRAKLLEINPECQERLPKRTRKKKPTEEQDRNDKASATKGSEKKARSKPAAAKKTPPKATTKKSPVKKKKAPPKKSAKPQTKATASKKLVKKKASKKTPTKKSTSKSSTKQLARRKPR